MELEISPNATGTLVKCPDCNDLLRTTASGFERQPDVGSKSTKPEITVQEDELPEVIFEDELPEVSGQHRIHVAPIIEQAQPVESVKQQDRICDINLDKIEWYLGNISRTATLIGFILWTIILFNIGVAILCGVYWVVSR
jgi:hypothetical protein